MEKNNNGEIEGMTENEAVTEMVRTEHDNKKVYKEISEEEKKAIEERLKFGRDIMGTGNSELQDVNMFEQKIITRARMNPKLFCKSVAKVMAKMNLSDDDSVKILDLIGENYLTEKEKTKKNIDKRLGGEYLK